MLWGSILGIKTDIFALTVTYDFKMPLVGAVMGTTYLVLMRLSILINRKNNKIAPDMGWPWGEYVFGTILWCAALI
jgi:hypothetical protein